MARPSLATGSGVNTTVYQSYDGGDPTNAAHNNNRVPWHRRMSPELWLWLIVIGAIAGLWAIAGSFRRILS